MKKCMIAWVPIELLLNDEVDTFESLTRNSQKEIEEDLFKEIDEEYIEEAINK